MTLEEICENVRQLSTTHGWDQSDPSVRMLHVMSEIGEVADALNSLATATGADTDAAKTALGHEIFDAIWNLCALANAAGIDLDDAARNKIALNAGRTWQEQRS